MSTQDKSEFVSFQFDMEQFGNALGNKIASTMDHTLTKITQSLDESYKGCCGCYPPCVKGCICIRYKCMCTNTDKHSYKYVCQRCEESNMTVEYQVSQRSTQICVLKLKKRT